MAGKKSVIETGVDKLVRLVRDQKRVSVKQAAKDLGVSMSSVEEWAEFLEEAGLITIQTKLATVYLVERDINEKAILSKLRDVQDEKASFLRRVESSLNSLQRDSDEVKLIDSEFRKIQSLLKNNLDALEKKLDKLEDFKSSRKALVSKENGIENEISKRLDKLDSKLKSERESFNSIMKDVEAQMAKVREGHVYLDGLRKSQKELQAKAADANKLLEKVAAELGKEGEEISTDEMRLDKSLKSAEELKEKIEASTSELTGVSEDLKKSRKELESMEKDFKKDLELLGKGEIEKLEVYKDSRAMMDRFRKFLSGTKDVEAMIKSAMKQEDSLRERFEVLAKKAQMFHVVSSSPKLKADLAALEKELSAVDSEKRTLSDRLRKLRMIMRSLVKK